MTIREDIMDFQKRMNEKLNDPNVWIDDKILILETINKIEYYITDSKLFYNIIDEMEYNRGEIIYYSEFIDKIKDGEDLGCTIEDIKNEMVKIGHIGCRFDW